MGRRRRIANDLDADVSMRTGINVEALTRLSKDAVRVISLAEHNRQGIRGAIFRATNRHVKEAVRAGLIETRPSLDRRFVYATLRTLCIDGHDWSDPGLIPSRQYTRYCKRCGFRR